MTYDNSGLKRMLAPRDSDTPITRTVRLSAADWEALDTAIPDAVEVITDIRSVCEMLSWTEDLDMPSIPAALRLMARVLRGLEDRELLVIDRLDNSIRRNKEGATP